MRTFIVVTAWLALTGCHEIPQDAVKPFAGEKEAKPYTDARFHGDKALYEKTLAERAKTQNEYPRFGGISKDSK